MGPFCHVAILLWIGLSGLLLLAPGVQATVSCTDQEIPAGCNTSIVCNFTQDIKAGRWDIGINRFPINTTTDDISSRKPVLSCNWGTGDKPQCFLSPEFTSYNISGNVAVVRIASVTKELEGIYRCQPINQDIQITNCKLNVKPAGKCDHENTLVPFTNPSDASSQVIALSVLLAVCILTIMVIFVWCVMRIRKGPDKPNVAEAFRNVFKCRDVETAVEENTALDALLVETKSDQSTQTKSQQNDHSTQTVSRPRPLFHDTPAQTDETLPEPTTTPQKTVNRPRKVERRSAQEPAPQGITVVAVAHFN